MVGKGERNLEEHSGEKRMIGEMRGRKLWNGIEGKGRNLGNKWREREWGNWEER